MTEVGPEQPGTELRRSSRDLGTLHERFERWLAGRLPSDAEPTVLSVSPNSGGGMSSDTVFVDAEWTDGDDRRARPLVARIAPADADVPVFPSYDLERQYRVIAGVAAATPVPVPDLRWFEPDDTHLGAPFFVMSRVDGAVPPDVMPYTFGDNWLHDAPEPDRARLQSATVRLLADLHDCTEVAGFGFLDYTEPGATPLRRHVAHTRAWYDWVAADAGRSPLIDRTFDWLDAHWPEHEGAPVLSWGDARIGNVIYRDFEPVAVLDWEMAAIGPRELDVAWLVYSHRVFQDLAQQLGAPGMPDFLRPGAVIAEYERRTGQHLTRLDFYGTYAALQWAIVFVRMARRAVLFGEREAPEQIDDAIMNRDALEQMLAGTYWS